MEGGGISGNRAIQGDPWGSMGVSAVRVLSPVHGPYSQARSKLRSISRTLRSGPDLGGSSAAGTRGHPVPSLFPLPLPVPGARPSRRRRRRRGKESVMSRGCSIALRDSGGGRAATGIHNAPPMGRKRRGRRCPLPFPVVPVPRSPVSPSPVAPPWLAPWPALRSAWVPPVNGLHKHRIRPVPTPTALPPSRGGTLQVLEALQPSHGEP